MNYIPGMVAVVCRPSRPLNGLPLNAAFMAAHHFVRGDVVRGDGYPTVGIIELKLS